MRTSCQSGTLKWSAGDTSEKAIVVDAAQQGNSPDVIESFHLVLEGARGGAGLGTRSATVDIQPDGSPGGQIEIDMNDLDAGESSLDGQYILLRNHYFQGRVCVTFTAKSGTAIAGKDFRADPMNVCWDDQDTDWKLPEIEIVDDSLTKATRRSPSTFESDRRGDHRAQRVGDDHVLRQRLTRKTSTQPGAADVTHSIARRCRSIRLGASRDFHRTGRARGVGRPRSVLCRPWPAVADRQRRGAALFVDVLASGRILVGGGDVDSSGSNRLGPDWCTLRIAGSSFTSQLDEGGGVYQVSQPSQVAGIAADNVARQADGKVVVVGRKIQRTSSYGCLHSFTPTIYRLRDNGSLDDSFGVIDLQELAGLISANSLALDPQGRIVIAGVRPIEDDPDGRNELVVLRLGTDGTLGSFGVSGIYTGPAADAWGQLESDDIYLIRMSSGSYRVSLRSGRDCKIVGVTARGSSEAAFGSAVL